MHPETFAESRISGNHVRFRLITSKMQSIIRKWHSDQKTVRPRKHRGTYIPHPYSYL